MAPFFIHRPVFAMVLAIVTMLAGAVLIAVLALLCDGLLLLVQRILTPAGLRARG